MAECDTPETNGDISIITLEHMPQQIHAWTADDDWTGIADSKQRRKLQNRQNQRKWRERKRADNQGRQLASREKTVSVPGFDSSLDSTVEKITCSHAPPDATEYLRSFEAAVRLSYMTRSPRSEHLIGLTRLNVHRAINENIRAIGMDPHWTSCDESISIFNLSPPIPSLSLEKIPASLRPTQIQQTVPHHPWLDFFPFPRMRDILIAAECLFDDDDLCHDLMAFWDTRNTGATLVVWGEPWDPRSWEVTEGFAEKWGWLLRGSTELLVSTNYWRRKRGERPLVWGRILDVQ
ncbi:hypothetical protein ASPVEDRAFT_170221 [Aspergillus versicolor CBS 583.65]|uniref:BZIP domain-containing protein n=1 Tax=Aspergillus versicolor CBS 583.65 TaxID=1036611 RepID=A0A1L9PNL2_ASPVE|nr:uncharacterized protein ASPVEDRAFT_170221 [Aspergillus versicolor CBS 583.65]OJJ02995.1 hypothetical protein ASPVEDRAFT_170221 [Aspergillus versicolor CBS 583.65]